MSKGKRRKLKAGQRQRVEGIVRRDASDVTTELVDAELRQVRLSFSSDEPYLRRSFWEDPWIEVLGHDADEIRLERLNLGASVDWNHSRSRDDRLGWVLEATVNEKTQRTDALIQISDRKDIDDIWNDVRAGGIRNVSVLYQIHERTLMRAGDDGPDEYRVNDWEPLNLSLVDIPADPTVGVGRSADPESSGHFYRVIDLEPLTSQQRDETIEGTNMKKTAKQKAALKAARLLILAGDDGDAEALKAARALVLADETENDDETVARSDVDDLVQTGVAAGVTAALKDEAQRTTDIRASFARGNQFDGIADLLEKCITDQACTLEKANDLLLAAIGERHKSVGDGNVQPGIDSADKFRDAFVQSIQAKAQVLDDDGKRILVDPQNPFRQKSLFDLAQECLRHHNLSTEGRPMDVVGRAFMMRSAIGFTSDDFAQILADVANKSVLKGFGEAEESWMLWCNVGNLSDFKQAKRVGLSAFDDLLLIGAGGEYQYGKFADKGETIQLAKYGRMFPIARETIIDDNIGALTSIPNKMGRAAARVPGDLAYIALTANPTMGDGVVLFHSSHSNLGTSGVISVTTVEEAQTLMALQTDVNNAQNGSNIQLAHLLVPVQIRGTANVLTRSEFDPASTTNSRAPNSVQGTFSVIPDARLSADSAAQWYGCADPSVADTVEVAFLDGVQAPRVEEKAGWTVDGVKVKVALEVAAAPMEHRTFVRNAGV